MGRLGAPPLLLRDGRGGPREGRVGDARPGSAGAALGEGQTAGQRWSLARARGRGATHDVGRAGGGGGAGAAGACEAGLAGGGGGMLGLAGGGGGAGGALQGERQEKLQLLLEAREHGRGLTRSAGWAGEGRTSPAAAQVQVAAEAAAWGWARWWKGQRERRRERMPGGTHAAGAREGGVGDARGGAGGAAGGGGARPGGAPAGRRARAGQCFSHRPQARGGGCETHQKTCRPS